MKTLQKTLLALTATAIMATTANAGINATAGQAYVGVKAGQFDVDVDKVKTDKATAYGVFGGYQFDPNWGVEAEFVGSDKADATFANGTKGEFDEKTYGLYGTYTYNFATAPVYAKGKLGIAKTEVEAKANGQTTKTDDTGLAYGVGLGYQATQAIALEAEYARPESDTGLWTIGAKFKF